ncbi:MAG: transglutaminase family protein, partial [Chitinophagaceae bacterium]
CQYTATISTSYDMVDCSNTPKQGAWELPPAALRYLNPSRFCQSDKLYRLANRMFGVTGNDFEKVMAINDWIYNNVEYLSGSTNSETSAYDTVTQQAGVCRDFAHLGIALCRALTIPARYCAAYAYQLQPQDFHACYEAYINGRWIIFDATRLAPINGLVKIAVGRDAADTAIANLFEDVNGNYVTVHTSLAEGDFTPFFYPQGTFAGLSYES